MSSVDRQRITAVKVIEGLGYMFTGTGWTAPDGAAPSLIDEADAMHSLLVLRADKLAGCTERSEEETELALTTDTIEAYEARRWPEGKTPRGKG